MLEGIELDRAQGGVERDHEISAAAAHVRARLLVGVAPHRLGRGGRGHAVAPLIARLTALRTITSFSPAALLSESAALAVLTLPSAIAAQARISESSFLPMKPLALSSPSSNGTPASPHNNPNASKKAIFSVRLLSRRSLPLIAASIRGNAARAFRAPSARTATMRTSRSSSMSARSSI